MEKMMVAVATIQETGKQVVILDQNNMPLVVTLAEALTLKFKGFPFGFVDVHEMFEIVEIIIN